MVAGAAGTCRRLLHIKAILVVRILVLSLYHIHSIKARIMDHVTFITVFVTVFTVCHCFLNKNNGTNNYEIRKQGARRTTCASLRSI
jgi:Mn2+/Fe2+ NRAMP family transporter